MVHLPHNPHDADRNNPSPRSELQMMLNYMGIMFLGCAFVGLLARALYVAILIALIGGVMLAISRYLARPRP